MKINYIDINNFKCFDHKKVNFDNNTKITGYFGCGKTTIFEAYKYVLDLKVDYMPKKKNFETTTVEIEFENINKKWVLKKQNEPKIINNKYEGTTTYYINNKLVNTAKEYHSLIEGIFNIDYSLLKLMIDITFFNDENYYWDKSKRKLLLFELFNINNNKDIINLSNKYEVLNDYFDKYNNNDDKMLIEFNNNIKSNKKNLDELNIILQEKKATLNILNNCDKLIDDIIKKNTSSKKDLENIKNALMIDTILSDITTINNSILEKLKIEQKFLILKNNIYNYRVEKINIAKNIIDNNFENDITFKLYEEQTSSAKNEIKFCCECCYKNIPYSNLSNGQKIFVNLNINNILQKLLNTNIPVWIDNYQDYNDIINTDHQLILIETKKNKNKSINNIVSL